MNVSGCGSRSSTLFLCVVLVSACSEATPIGLDGGVELRDAAPSADVEAPFADAVGAADAAEGGDARVELDVGQSDALDPEPVLELRPSTLDLTATLGGSQTSTIEVRNAGPGPVSGLLFRFAGHDAAELTHTVGCEGRLVAGESCTMTITFHANSYGSKRATLIAEADQGSVALAEIRGLTTSPPQMLLRPSIFAFSAWPSAFGPIQRFLLSNEGDAPVGPIQSATVSASGGGFSIFSDECTQTTLDPGMSCAVDVRFSLPAPGSSVGALSIATGIGVLTASVSGWVPPNETLTVIPTRAEFGTATIGTRNFYAVSLLNLGTALLASPSALSIIGADAAAFVATNRCGGGLGVGEGCDIYLFFTPSHVGPHEAVLELTTPSGSLSVRLKGTGVASAALSFDAPSLVLFSDPPAARLISLQNSGSTPTGTLSVTSSDPSKFSVVSDNCSGQSVAAGSSCSLSVVSTASTGGEYHGVLRAESASGASAEVALVTWVRESFLVIVGVTGGGEGVIRGAGRACTGGCTRVVPRNATITLTVEPTGDSVFRGFFGACQGVAPCVLSMSDNRGVTAELVRTPSAIQVHAVGIDGASGSVTSGPPRDIDCAGDCTQDLRPGEELTLEAHPASGSAFEGWSGACSGMGLTCTLRVFGLRDVTATFSPPNVMFASSTTLEPGVDLATADAECARLAATAGLAGDYLAWLSVPGESPIRRLVSVSPLPEGWTRSDGAPFAGSLTSLVQGRVLWPPRLTESNMPLPDGARVVTRANASGGRDESCENGSFTSGDPSSGTRRWTAAEIESCVNAVAEHVYCFGTRRHATIPVARAPGRLLFVSSAPFDPATGLAGADAICSSEAAAARLPGTYRALLGTTQASAASRFDLSGPPWIRSDGIPIVSAGAAIAGTADLAAAPNVNAGGADYFGDVLTWTGVTAGVDRPSTAAASCADWTNHDASVGGSLGDPTRTSGAWTAAMTAPCDRPAHVYCLQL